MKDRADCMDRFPKAEHKYSTQGNDVENLMLSVVGLYHGDIESTQYWYTVYGEMGRRNEEARSGGYDDGDEGRTLHFECDEWIYEWECMGEEWNGDDEIGASAYLRPDCLFLFIKILVSHL